MLEYLTPSYSLDILTTIIIAAGNLEEETHQKTCKKVDTLEIFNLLR